MCGNDRLRFDAACEVVRVANNLVAAKYVCQAGDTAAKIRAYFEAHP